MLAVTGCQPIGGAIISLLPLPILPFVPAQTVENFLSHVLLGLTQLPLIVVGHWLRVAPVAREGSPPFVRPAVDS